MENLGEILQAVFIGVAVASVLLQTCRYSKAIELFSECLVFGNEHASKIKEAGLLEEIGDLYRLTDEQVKAKERYEEALKFYAILMMMHKPFGIPVIKQNKETEERLLNKLGHLSLSLFEYPQAKYYFQRELEISKETGNRKEEGKALHGLGSLYKTTEEYKQAKKYYEEAMTILEEAGEIKELGEVCSELGRVCRTLREFQKAKTLQMRALEISVKRGDKRDEMSDHRHLAGAHEVLGEYDEAKKCYQKAIKISKELDDKKGEASTYSDLGVFYRDYLHDFSQAEYYYKKALEIYEEIGDLLNVGSENRELGDLYCLLGKHEEARKCHVRALRIKKQIGDKRGIGDAYTDLANFYQSLGNYRKAKEYFELALAISKETNHLRGQGVDCANIGTMCQQLGDYNKAYEYHKKALEIMIRTDHSEGLPAAYHNLGVIYEHFGEYVKADKLYKKALVRAKEFGNKRMEAAVLSSLASVEEIVGELEKAITHYKEALEISKQMGDIKQEVQMNSNLGNVYQSQGDASTAMKYFKESLTISKRIGSKDLEGISLINLGTLHLSLGEYAKAKKCYNQALEISRQTGHKRTEMTISNQLGTLHMYLNEYERALECFQKALLTCEQTRDLRRKSTIYCNMAAVYMVRLDTPKALSCLSASIKSLEELRVSIGESECFKIGFADKNAAPYQLMVAVLLELGCVSEALSISELARARSLAESMATQYSSHDLPRFDPNRWIDFANVIQKKSCTCLSFCFGHERLLCWVIKEKRVQVVTNKNLTSNIRPQGMSIQDWLETLADQSYRYFLLLQGERCEDRSLVLPDDIMEARSPSQIEEVPTTSQAKEQKEIEDKEPPVLKELYNLIMAPVFQFLKGSEIVIVPDRSLYRIPFAALMDENGAYLSEKFTIRFVPSLTTLKLIQDSPANYHSQTGVLIVGDPEVGLAEFKPLPCAREEVKIIGRMLHVRPLTGKQATKQAVLQRMHSVSLIHIAAHGDAERGAIALAPSQHIKGKPTGEDFVLTMSDISKVRLRAKLVVLSCCHSGLGQIKAEGVVGIARAFLGSGARSVLVSLWAVEDSATMQFMKQFYGHLVRGKSASQCLHETMKWMRGNPQYCEVRKWAPFMLVGDDVSFNFKK